MTDELPIYEPVKPIGRCGSCGRDLYPHSSLNQCGYAEQCPMHGDKWRQVKLACDMRNTFAGKLP